ncbi:MAG: DNA-directed RNA polymerase subunit omega [Actinomycetota bacterium]
MAYEHDSMMATKIEDLLDVTGSKFSLVTLASKRARQINAYFGQLGGGIGTSVPPQVTSVAHKPLTIAFEEIGAGKIIMGDPEAVAAAEAAAEEARLAAEADMAALEAEAAEGEGDDKGGDSA